MDKITITDDTIQKVIELVMADGYPCDEEESREIEIEQSDDVDVFVDIRILADNVDTSEWHGEVCAWEYKSDWDVRIAQVENITAYYDGVEVEIANAKEAEKQIDRQLEKCVKEWNEI